MRLSGALSRARVLIVRVVSTSRQVAGMIKRMDSCKRGYNRTTIQVTRLSRLPLTRHRTITPALTTSMVWVVPVRGQRVTYHLSSHDVVLSLDKPMQRQWESTT